jgi:hypothetical protein
VALRRARARRRRYRPEQVAPPHGVQPSIAAGVVDWSEGGG